MDTKNDLTDDDEESSTSSGLSQGWSGRQLTKFNPTVGNGVYELASQEQYASSEDEDASSKDAYTSSKYEDASSKDEDASSKDDDASKYEDASFNDENSSSDDEEVTREASNALDSINDFYDYPPAFTQEPEVGISEGNLDVIHQIELEEIKAALIYSTGRVAEAINNLEKK